MIDWNKHEDATCVSVTYFDDNGDAISTSWADRPTQKTVADAVEQEGEKWTHKTAESEYCRILIDKPDQFGNVVILKEEWGYSDYPLSSLKPIKPTISKAEAWDKVASEDLELSVSVSAIKEQYDII